jgi:hypothetical protein
MADRDVWKQSNLDGPLCEWNPLVFNAKDHKGTTRLFCSPAGFQSAFDIGNYPAIPESSSLNLDLPHHPREPPAVHLLTRERRVSGV